MSLEIAVVLLEIRAVELRPDTPFTWTSGIKSPIYCDTRLVLGHPEKREHIISACAEKARSIGLQDIAVIAGVAVSGIPFAAMLAHELGKPMVFVRKAAKEHGKQKLVEGNLEAGQKVLVVEELVSTGGSLFTAVDALREEGAIVEHALVLFSYGFPQAREGAEQRGLAVHALTDFPELVKAAHERGNITRAEEKTVREFAENPAAWWKEKTA